MKSLNTEHLQRLIDTLEQSIQLLEAQNPDSLLFEVYRNAVIKGYELSLETSAKLIKKCLKPYFANPREVDQLVFKDLFRHAGLHGFLTPEETKRWFDYRDNRNNTAHDYGIGFAEETLSLLPLFIKDLRTLKQRLDHGKS